MLRTAPALLAATLASLAVTAAPAPAATKWLCKPGASNNPCESSITATRVDPPRSDVVQRDRPNKRAKVDCFYVYPTVSGQTGLNANLDIEEAQTGVAKLQASKFSQECKIYAPVYRQLTVRGIGSPDAQRGIDIAYKDVKAAWLDYLRRYNKGRGVVLIGHSQGTGMLNRLIREQLDGNAKTRKKLVSALLIGGSVKVPRGKDVGGDFKKIPACRKDTQTGCVVAYSTFYDEPPTGTIFGRADSGFAAVFGGASGRNLRLLCTNPADLKTNRRTALDPYFAGTETAFVTYPGLYTAQCKEKNGTTWLDVDDAGRPDDPRPRVAETLGPTWGLHLFDVNLALGDLVSLVERQGAAYLARR